MFMGETLEIVNCHGIDVFFLDNFFWLTVMQRDEFSFLV